MKFSPRWDIISKGFANKELSEISAQSNQNLIRPETISQLDSRSKNDSVISDLVSELFNHIESKDSFNFISDLLLTSLSIHKKKYSIENSLLTHEETLDTINNIDRIRFKQKLTDTKTEYLSISNDIHSILASCPDLSSDQKLDYCDSQRYFMKMYMNEIVVKLKNQ